MTTDEMIMHQNANIEQDEVHAGIGVQQYLDIAWDHHIDCLTRDPADMHRCSWRLWIMKLAALPAL